MRTTPYAALVVALVLAGSAAGCGEPEKLTEAECTELRRHTHKLGGVSPVSRSAARDTAFVNQCTNGDVLRKDYDCLMDANSMETANACPLEPGMQERLGWNR